MFEYLYRAFVHRKKTELDASVIQSGDTGMQVMRITDGVDTCRGTERDRLCSFHHDSSGSRYVPVCRQPRLGRLHKVWLALGPRPTQLPFRPATLNAKASAIIAIG